MNVTECAKKYVGYLEHATPELLGVFRANTGKCGYTMFSEIISSKYRFRNFQGLPWCAVFVHAVYLESLGKKKSCILLGKPHPGTRVLLRRFRRSGRLREKHYIPNPGDIVFMRNRVDELVSHVGIVLEASGDTVLSIEGNTVDPSGVFEKTKGGAVAVRERKRNDPVIVCYGKCIEE